jgi:putative ABC transport system ATP-binding protein
MAEIVLKDVNKYYHYGTSMQVHAVKDASVTFAAGTRNAVMGVSGSGKSTLLHIMGCLDFANSGECIINGRNVNQLSNKEIFKIRNLEVGFVLQHFGLIQEVSTLDNCIAPAMIYGNTYREAKRKALRAIERVGIIELVKRKVSQMSGGQRQRVAIARAIVNKPSIILADEPTGALDTNTARDIMKLINDVLIEDSVFVVVTHNNAIAENCGQIFCLSDGYVKLKTKGSEN